MEDLISEAGKKIWIAGICFLTTLGLAAIQIILFSTQALDDGGLTSAMAILSLLGLISVILGSLSLVQGGSLLMRISKDEEVQDEEVQDEEVGDTKQDNFPAWITWVTVIIVLFILLLIVNAIV